MMRKTILFFLSLFVAIVTNAQVPAISYTSPQTYIVGNSITALTPINTGGAVPATVPRTVTTFAGSTTSGNTNGTGTSASFKSPMGLAVDASGNVYVADYGNNLIRKITSAGVVTTLAGSGSASWGNGTGTSASFFEPAGVTVDASGNVYVADCVNHMIRKITSAGVVTTLAGSGLTGKINATGMSASFNYPYDVAVDASGNLYVADYTNKLIRKVTSAGVVTTYAGSGTAGSTNGTGTSASFYAPIGIAVDASGNVYVADIGSYLIRKITSGAVVTTFASVGFNRPADVAVDALGNVYVADEGNYLIRKISPAGVVTTLAGSGTSGSANGIGTAASFNSPDGVTVDNELNVYVGDTKNNMIRKIVQTGYSISPVLPVGLSFDATTGTISGTPTTASAATTYTITATNASGISTTTISIATVSKTAPVITWANPTGITYGTALTATQLNATADVAGTFTYTPASGTILNAGTQSLQVDFTPTDATNYATVSKTVSLDVAKVTPVITWTAPVGITYGTALTATQLNATADVAGTFTYTPVLGTILSAGTQSLQVDFTPTDATNYATVSKTVSLDIAQAMPIITWANPVGITYGTALSATQLNATADVAGTFTYTPVLGTILSAGT